MATTVSDPINIGIVGATGYTGVELLRLLAQHPNANIVAVTSRQESGLPVADMFPNLRGHINISFQSPDEAKLEECDVVFFATPHGVAMSEAKNLLKHGVKIIDLAADFRLQDTQVFQQWYKMPHACPDVLKESVYGLVEVNRERIRDAKVVGNPVVILLRLSRAYCLLSRMGKSSSIRIILSLTVNPVFQGRAVQQRRLSCSPKPAIVSVPTMWVGIVIYLKLKSS